MLGNRVGTRTRRVLNNNGVWNFLSDYKIHCHTYRHTQAKVHPWRFERGVFNNCMIFWLATKNSMRWIFGDDAGHGDLLDL